MRDTLFLIRAPFEDMGDKWYCNDCATMEGALLANPQWARAIDVRRLPYPRPRHEIIALIGEENQSMPVLVIAEEDKAPIHADRTPLGRAFLTKPKEIAKYLAETYGGAGPHP